jgi:lipoprotein-anchoring transpeptidase ErfK/SrfK
MSTWLQTYQKEAPASILLRTSFVQRKCACGGTPGLDGACATCRAQRWGLQRQGAPQTATSAAPLLVHEALQGPGQPLDTATRTFMEPRFGHDFSRVRVHTDARAVASAQAIGALAYTRGRDIVFGAGQYAPNTTEGQRLLAHELTHVVQQGDAAVQSTLMQGQQGDVYEQEAEQVSERVMGAASGQRPELRVAPYISMIQRQFESDVLSDAEPEELTAEDMEDMEVEDGDSPPGSTVPVGNISEAQLESAEPEAAVSDEEPIQMQGDKGKPKAPDKPKTPPPEITEISVDLSSQKMTITRSDGTKSGPITISSGKGLPNTKDDPCKDPNKGDSNCTPVGEFTPGTKGDASHKNKEGDAMSWYVEFNGEGADGRGIGIHDSQPVTGAPASHGCIRVDEKTAKLINKNVTTKTKIIVEGKAPTKPWSKAKKKK